MPVTRRGTEVAGEGDQREPRRGGDVREYIRARIDRYAGFMHGMKDYLAAQQKAHPELKDSIAALKPSRRGVGPALHTPRER